MKLRLAVSAILMMKMNFKNFAIITAVFVTVLLFISPVSSVKSAKAQQGGSQPQSQGENGKVQNQAQGNFCERIGESFSKFNGRLFERQEKLQTKRGKIDEKIAERQQKREELKEQLRIRFEENRQEHFSALEEKAGNDAQKQAVLRFREEATIAIQKRQETVDSIISAFRTEFEQAVASRKAAIDSITAVFEEAKKQAADKAEADCLAGIDQQTIRQNLRDALKAAQDKFRTDNQAIAKLQDSLKQLIEQKKQAMEQVQNTFRIEMETIKNELKDAFFISSEEE